MCGSGVLAGQGWEAPDFVSKGLFANGMKQSWAQMPWVALIDLPHGCVPLGASYGALIRQTRLKTFGCFDSLMNLPVSRELCADAEVIFLSITLPLQSIPWVMSSL